MCLTTRGYAAVVDEIAQRADRWIALGGGGYEVTVVPRAWTLAFARMTEIEPPEDIPPSEAAHYPGGEGVKLHDSDDAGVSEDLSAAAREFAEKAVQSAKQFVFPYHGLPI
jgi:acetoin utilization protein AcuC